MNAFTHALHPAPAPYRRATPPVSAIVVVRNEAPKLDACLASLAWCDELIVVDLESTDASAAIAARHRARILSHPFSPIVEPVRCFAAQHARHDWLLFVDPDERVPGALIGDLARAIAEHPRAGVIRLPWQFYFKGERLDGTVWGGPARSKRFLVHRRRAAILPFSHAGSRPLAGFEEIAVAPREGNHVRHEWMDSYAALIEKHVRYARAEGRSRFEAGQRFGLRSLLVDPARDAWSCFRLHEGWRLGLRGLTLSLFYGAFRAAGALSLLAYQIGRARAPQRHAAAPADAPVPAAVAPLAATSPAFAPAPASDQAAAGPLPVLAIVSSSASPSLAPQNDWALALDGALPPSDAYRRAA